MKLKIALTCPDADAAKPWRNALTTQLLALGADAEIALWPERFADPDYALVWGAGQGFLDAHRGVKALFTLGAGVDGLLKLDVPAAMPIIRIEDGGMAAQMAEYVCHAALRHVRQFDVYESAMRTSAAGGGAWQPLEPRRPAQFPVGIMGMGALGSRVAQALQAFGFPVNGWSRSAKEIPGVASFGGEASLDRFLQASRILVCMLPLTPDTRDLINRARLQQLQSPGYFINVARGAHVVEADLLALIDSGHLAGAALDVFREEPLPASHPFRAHPRIALTPHTAAQTLIDESAQQIAHKIVALERGESVGGLVDRSRAY
jgi:glyoxylate/hydroxypyruvate reductase